VNYYERRRTLAAFSHVAILSQGTAIVGDAGSTDQVDLMRVSPEYFAMLGVDSIMGRALTDEEMTYQTDGVAILTDTCWRHRFNADPHILGRLAQSIDHRIAVRDARWNRKPRRPASAPWIHRGPDCVGLRAELAVVP
jgi:hypothetical protein